MDLSGTFDTTNALSGMYLWLIFNYLAAMLNCDLQRAIHSNPFVLHAFGVLAFFFLFTLLDTNNKTSISSVWVKTLFIYVLFVLMTKSKWYFVIPVLAALLVDQSLKKGVAIKEAAGEDVTEARQRQHLTSQYINAAIIAVIIAGTIHYAVLQRIEYGKNFSWFMLLAGVTKCRPKPVVVPSLPAKPKRT